MIDSKNIFNNDFLQKWTFLFSARILPLISLFIITIVYSKKLSFSDYGIYQSVWMYTNILIVIIGFGISTMILSTPALTFLECIKNNKRKIAGAYILLSVLSVGFIIINNKNLALKTEVLVVIFSLTQLLSIIFESLLIKKGKEAKLFLINTLYSILFLSAHIYIIYNFYNLNWLITSVIGITLFKIIFIFQPITIKTTTNKTITDSGFLNNWMYCGFNEITGVISKWIDKIFLLSLLTTSQFAVFFNGSFEIPLFGILITVAGNLLMVEVSKKDAPTDKIVFAFQQNFKLLSIIVFPVFYFLLFNATQLFAIIFHHKYDDSIPVFIISLFVLPIRINNYGALLQSFQKANKVMFGSMIDIVLVVILMFFLYPYYGTKGVAAAVVMGTYLQIVYYLIVSSKTIGVSIAKMVPYKDLVLRFIALFAIYFLITKIPMVSNGLSQLIIQGLISILIIIVGLIKFNSTNLTSSHGNYQKI